MHRRYCGLAIIHAIYNPTFPDRQHRLPIQRNNHRTCHIPCKLLRVKSQIRQPSGETIQNPKHGHLHLLLHVANRVGTKPHSVNRTTINKKLIKILIFLFFVLIRLVGGSGAFSFQKISDGSLAFVGAHSFNLLL